MSSSAIAYSINNNPRVKWIGYVLSWEAKTNSFTGKPKEVPYPVSFETWASSYAEAEYLLGLLAEEQGYALGGVFDISPKLVIDKKKKSSITLPSRKKETELDRFLRLASPDVIARLSND